MHLEFGVKISQGWGEMTQHTCKGKWVPFMCFLINLIAPKFIGKIIR